MSSGVVAPARAVCVVRDPALRRALQRSLCGNGARVEFRESLDEGPLASDAIVFLDHRTRTGFELAALTRRLDERGRIVVLGGSLDDGELVALLRERALDHVIADPTTPDEHELAVTSAKLHSGDIFGLEKYLAWGVTVAEVEVSTYQDKCAALDELGRAAEWLGARKRLVNRVQSTADELLMNALYDAPAAVGMRSPVAAASQRLDVPPSPSALLRYGCDGRYMALSVLDRFGALDKRAVLDAVLRARAELGRPRAQGGAGAGLGIYFVLSSVTRFIVNVQPGRLTEVVCLFDVRERGRDATAWARSLHVFTAA
ncbi:MAG TPA: hypothetical protein VK698_22195 [Kofleriaceae bacterium]|nr:hypothetical protein [Kofleriaceae bacterium]